MKQKADTKSPREHKIPSTKTKTVGKTTAKTRVRKASATVMPTGSEEIAVAAFLNWCQRRNQGLPDDPIADWIMAETTMG